MTDAPSEPNQDVRPARARRMLASLIDGAGLDAIGAEEQLPANRVQAIVREELGRRWVAPIADFAKIQIARLENLYLVAMDGILRGEIAAIDRALRIFDRLDRYHGFSRAAPVVENYGEEERARLLAKIESIVTRLEENSPANDGA